MGFQTVKLADAVTITGPTGATGGIQPSGYGTGTIDFGATPTDNASLVITGLADMLTTSHVMVFIEGDDTTADNDANAHSTLAVFSICYVTARTAGVGFTANILLAHGLASNTFKIHYIFIK